MSNDTREALARWIASLPELPSDAPYWTNGMFKVDCENARAALATQPAQATLADRIEAHSGSGKCEVCKTDNCILTGLKEPSIWNCLKEDEC